MKKYSLKEGDLVTFNQDPEIFEECYNYILKNYGINLKYCIENNIYGKIIRKTTLTDYIVRLDGKILTFYSEELEPADLKPKEFIKVGHPLTKIFQ